MVKRFRCTTHYARDGSDVISMISCVMIDEPDLVSAEEDRWPLGGSMPAVDTLLTLLVEDTRNIAARIAAAGYDEYEIREAWAEARRLGYTESTGLGQDRLTEAGRTRAQKVS